jgi:hypothetical protein
VYVQIRGRGRSGTGCWGEWVIGLRREVVWRWGKWVASFIICSLSPNIRMIKPRAMSCACHVTCVGEKRNAHRSASLRNEATWQSRRKWQSSIKTDLEEIGGWVCSGFALPVTVPFSHQSVRIVLRSQQRIRTELWRNCDVHVNVTSPFNYMWLLVAERWRSVTEQKVDV